MPTVRIHPSDVSGDEEHHRLQDSEPKLAMKTESVHFWLTHGLYTGPFFDKLEGETTKDEGTCL